MESAAVNFLALLGLVPLRSTGSVLTCRASGGPKGGTVEFTLSDGNRLAKSGGSFPYTKELAPGEEVSFEIACTGQGESSGEDDIVVNGIFTENKTGEMLAAEDRLTVVRVECSPEKKAPNNKCFYRHKVGVREVIDCIQSPPSPSVQWSAEKVSRMRTTAKVQCPLFATEQPIVAKCKDTEYRPLISVVEPNGIEARNVRYWKGSVSTNCAGGIGLEMKLYIKPLDVSFEKIAVEEVPCTEGMHSGYFALPQFSGDWYHSRDNGAGRWHDISEGNIFGDDTACISNELYRVNDSGLFVEDENYGWWYGDLSWKVPFGWNEMNTAGDTAEFKRFAENTLQEMVIFPNGMSGVRKFYNMATRYIDGRIFLNGVQKE